MTKKQKKIAKLLVSEIRKAGSVASRSEAVKAYSIFMSECREQKQAKGPGLECPSCGQHVRIP